MKYLAALSLILVSSAFSDEKTLSETDRQLLLERLQEIQNTSDTTVKGRLQAALTAFRKGRDSDAAAHDLYLNCIEKIRFEDQLRKTSEFRDWKKRHKERTDTPGFRLALRHQLNWLALTLEAAQSKEITALGSRGIAVVDAILNDAEKLKGQEKFLRTDVLGSVFADAYSVNSLTIANWPNSPLEITALYEGVVLPSLRNPESLASLRKAWLKRIKQQGLLLEKWTTPGTTDRDRKPAFEQWLAEGHKDLVWAMETDLFKNGDQKASSIRMLEHLKQNLTHKSAPTWITQFTSLVEGSPVGPLPTEEEAAPE